MLESTYSIKMNKNSIPNLSERYWVDCDPNNNGCVGGNTKLALEFVKDITGFYYEGELPYDD